MADNVTLDAGSGGATLATASLTWSGDTAQIEVIAAGILSGSEGSWTFTEYVGGAGAVTAGTQRVTLASDDPAVVDLAAIEVLITAGNVDLAALEVLVTAGNVDLAAMEVLLGTIDADTDAIKTAVELIDNAISGAGFNITQFNGAAVPIGAGVEATALRVTLATDSTGVITVDTTGTTGLEVVQDTAADLNMTEASAAAIKTAVELIDDAVYVDDADWTDSTSKHMLVGGLYQSSPQTITDGDVGPIQVSSQGHVISHIVDGAGNDLEFAKENDNWSAADHGIILFARDVDSTPDKYRAVQVDASGYLKIALQANSGVDIGDVDVLSVVPGTAAANLGKARASALGATDTGVAAMAVRNDDLADLAGADADYTPLQVDNQGAVYVNAAASEPKRASGVAAGGTPGTDDIVAGVASRKIRVLALGLFATSATVNNVFLDNADNDLLFNTGNPLPLSIDADGDTVAGFVLPYNPGGWFEADTVNEAVTLNSSAAQDIAWTITYCEVL